MNRREKYQRDLEIINQSEQKNQKCQFKSTVLERASALPKGNHNSKQQNSKTLDSTLNS